MSVILGRAETYDQELMLKLSKLELALIYVRHGGDVKKVASKWYGSEDLIKDASTGDPESFFKLDKKVRQTSLDTIVGGSWTKKKIIEMIGKLVKS